MKIGTITPSFKGYVEIFCRRETDCYIAPVTFSTNAITYTPTKGYGHSGEREEVEICSGEQKYTAVCSYDTFQKACLESDTDDMKGKVVKIEIK